jgi:hypothetical protein
MAKTVWFGDEISKRIRDASAAAIDEVLEVAAKDAEEQHWWNRRGGHLEEETIAEPAIKGREIVAGRFGTTRRKGFYGLFLELREPFLRPAADRSFPALPAVLQEKLHD